jgi:hypothetical protein
MAETLALPAAASAMAANAYRVATAKFSTEVMIDGIRREIALALPAALAAVPQPFPADFNTTKL